MTDNRTDSQNNQSQSAQPQIQAQTKPGFSHLTAASKAPESSSKGTEATEPQMKKVDISLAGVSYQIFCPIHEEEELRSAVYYINNFVIDIKKKAPNLPQENLLVLCCLNLYEKINAHKKTDDSQRQESKQTEALLSKIMKDAQSVL